MSELKEQNPFAKEEDRIPTLGRCFETEACRVQMVQSREFEVHFQASRDVISLPYFDTKCGVALDSDKVVPTKIVGGAANFHPAGSNTYSRTEAGRTTFLAIDFEPYVREAVEDEFSQKARNESSLNLENPNFQSVLADGQSFFRDGGTLGRLSIEAMTLRLLFHTLESSFGPRKQRDFETLNGSRLARIFDLIEMCLIDDISLTELSDLVGCTPLELLQAFHKATGIALPEYVHERRLAHAMRIVKEEDIGTESVAKDVGFSSADVLIKAFQARLGITPSQYRRQSVT